MNQLNHTDFDQDIAKSENLLKSAQLIANKIGTNNMEATTLELYLL